MQRTSADIASESAGASVIGAPTHPYMKAVYLMAQLDGDPGMKLPTAHASREKMQEHVPAARRLLEKVGATDLLEIILGEDA